MLIHNPSKRTKWRPNSMFMAEISPCPLVEAEKRHANQNEETSGLIKYDQLHVQPAVSFFLMTPIVQSPKSNE